MDDQGTVTGESAAAITQSPNYLITPGFLYVDAMGPSCTGLARRLPRHEAKGRNLKQATHVTGAMPV
jgi:hypothetical protein